MYVLTALLGLKVDAVSGFATLIWLPTGISLATLLLFGIRLWPAIFLGAVLANAWTGAALPVAVGIGIGNTLEALFAAVILRYLFGFDNSLERITDVIGLIVIGAFLSTMISATIGVVSLSYGGIVNSQTLPSTWVSWWIGDMVSNLVIAPLILVWAKIFRYLEFEKKKRVELVTAFSLLLITGFFVFGDTFGIKYSNVPITYLVFPPLIWIALRFGQVETVTGIFILSALALWTTVFGSSPFTQGKLSERLIQVQTFMAVVAATSMILSASLSERRKYEKFKDDLIAIVSHELKTPLTSIKLLTQLLAHHFRKKREIKSIRYLKKMDKQLNKFTRIINDLLDVSRLRNKKFGISKKYFILSKLIKDTVESMKLVSKHTFIIKSKQNSLKVFADKDRIEQVLINLLSNAIKYSPQGKKILVQVEKKKNVVVVSVSDEGIGISPYYYEKLFHPFFRIINPVVTNRTGFGIGLYISNEIVKQHGGKMWFVSKPDQGSTFYFSLPLS